MSVAAQIAIGDNGVCRSGMGFEPEINGSAFARDHLPHFNVGK